MKRSWNLLDAAVVSLVCFLLASLLSMGIARQRGAARQSDCENNLKQIGLAFHNYHSAYKQLPMGAGGTDSGGIDQPTAGNAGRLSAFVGLTPFMEHQRVWEMISNPSRRGANEFPSMGPVPWFDAQAYQPWSLRPQMLVCPEDDAADRYALASNYVMNYGDGVEKVFFGPGDWPNPKDSESARLANATQRGMFSRQKVYKFRDVLDGLSNTLLLAESQIAGKRVARDVAGLPLQPALAIDAQTGQAFWPVGREARWCDGLLRSSGFQTILPPGSPSATSEEGDQTAVMSASSHHGPGTHGLFGDGAVRFINSSIDAGDPKSPSVGLGQPDSGLAPPGSQSPYGVWGALGTRASGEVIRDEQLRGPSGAVTNPRRSISETQLAEVRKQPIRTWTAAGGRGTMRGWLVSCSPAGEVVLVNEAGDVKYVTLSDLIGEDAYFIVESLAAEKIRAQDQLLEQLRDAVGLLEKKDFNTFLARFVDATQLGMRDVTAASSAVYQQRGILIQAFDDAIRATEMGAVKIESVDNRLLASFGMQRGPSPRLVMQFTGGRWYWLPSR